MSGELSAFLLLISVVLLLCGALGRVVLHRSPSPAWRLLGAVLIAAGVALAGWVAWSNYAPHSPAGPPVVSPVAQESGAAPRGDPVPTAITALQGCATAARPAAAPDGTKATREQMLAARSAFQQYDAANNAYLKCVDEAIERVKQQFPNAQPAELATLRTLQDGAHNMAIDQEQAAADQLNVQVRLFKAQHPGT
jgi:hypothetical protein